MTETSARLSFTAVVVIVTDTGPHILTVSHGSDQRLGLPEHPFILERHRTFEKGVRDSVADAANLSLGYVEQLYTFGDRGRVPNDGTASERAITVGYVALTRLPGSLDVSDHWHDWYSYFPWEDWRDGRPAVIDGLIKPKLTNWIEDAENIQQRLAREQRVLLCFGASENETDQQWNNERVLERYELLYSANMLPESRIHKGLPTFDLPTALGRSMILDHRRILATAMSRIRGKIKYRPVIFELVPKHFTLFYLQRVVESLTGNLLHKQNFRRLVETQGLVDRTRTFETNKRGRPAKLFQFRSTVELERPAPGVRSGYRVQL